MVALQPKSGIYGKGILYKLPTVDNKEEFTLTESELEECIRGMTLLEKVHVSEHSTLAKLLEHYGMGKITDEAYTPNEEILQFILEKEITGAVKFNREYQAVYKLALNRRINAGKVWRNATQGIDEVKPSEPFVVALPPKRLSKHELGGRGTIRHDEFTLA